MPMSGTLSVSLPCFCLVLTEVSPAGGLFSLLARMMLLRPEMNAFGKKSVSNLRRNGPPQYQQGAVLVS